MQQTESVPCLPDSAPFTPEQRAYLNGFLAGLFSRTPTPAPGTQPSLPVAEPIQPVSILYGSQTGNAENLARKFSKEAGKRGFAPTVHELGNYPLSRLAADERVLIVTSTYGDGEPPDNARSFWAALNAENAPRLEHTRFSVCALGDSNYPKFCGFGKEIEARLTTLGASLAAARADCDVDFTEPAAKWLDAALAAFARGPAAVTSPSKASTPAPSSEFEPTRTPQRTTHPFESASFGRNRPFPARLVAQRQLNGQGSGKDIQHFEISLAGSGLNYEAGDALGVFPTNCPELVEEFLGAAHCTGMEQIRGAEGGQTLLRDALRCQFDLNRISPSLLEAMAGRSGDPELKRLTDPAINGELTQFLRGRDVIDLLRAWPNVVFSSEELVTLLKKLQPRMYSISSSPRAYPECVHLTVSVVRYESQSRRRKGVCSTFLAERTPSGNPVPVFVHTNPAFRPPPADAPMIMVGPGTGIAPFRAFLQEREAAGAKGDNWLFFGDQHAATDFLYREELEAMRRNGILTKLDTAFSRDQEEKIYVQHRLLEHAREVFDWLERGAHFYVCGDASRMARDVEAALLQSIQSGGQRTPEQAADYVATLRANRRYQRDVY